MFLGWVQKIAPYSQEIHITHVDINNFISLDIIHDKQDIGKTPSKVKSIW